MIFSLFTLLCTTGFLSFPLLAFHALKTGLFPAFEIPILYALAMLVDAAVAPISGSLYDKKGNILLLAIPVTGILIPFLGLGMSRGCIYTAAILFGVSMGLQETVLRAFVADRIHISKRGTAYGIFNTVYGAGFFIGGALIGWLYENSQDMAPVAPVLLSVLACVIFFLIRKGIPDS